MARNTGNMNEVERAQHAAWTEKLNSSLSTEAEKKTARLKIDSLEWQGESGPFLEKLATLGDRVEAIEASGQALTEQDRASILALRDVDGDLPAKVKSLEELIAAMVVKCDELSATVENHHNDQQRGWRTNNEATVKNLTLIKQAEQDANDGTTATGSKFREIEAAIATIRRDLSTLVVDAVADAVAETVLDFMAKETEPELPPHLDTETDVDF